ncbi:hypothetical protein Tco_1221755 [Tanacetum coccineum]
MVFHQIYTEEVSDRFVAPCFVNRLEAYDGEINLGVEENMISNEFAVKLCLEHEVKRGNNLVKKELIVALRAINDFEAGTVTIYPDIDPFLEDIEEEKKSLDDWDHLLDFNLDDVPLLGGEELSSFVCKMGKSSRNKKRSMENMSLFYQDIGISSSADEVELDGKIVKEEEEAVKRIKGEALKEKDDPGAFIFPIRLVGVTTLIAKFLILDIPIDRDAPIVVGQGFLRTIGGIVNTPERLFSSFDGFCHQTFCIARSNVMRNA